MGYLSERISRIDTSEVRKVFDLASRIKNPKNLSIGQPDFPVPEPVKEAIARSIRNDQTAYSQTQGILPLREALSGYYSQQKIDFHPEHIVVSTGVASVLFLLFDVLFDPGDTVLFTDPYFLIYQSLAEYHELNVMHIPENFSEKEIQELRQALSSGSHLPNKKKLKAIVFASPSNPTGKILTRKQLGLLAKISDEFGSLMISDEIYSAYDYEEKFVHTAEVCPGQTITLGGFSKSHAMTGLRVGYMAVPPNLSQIAEKLAALQQHSIVCSPQPAQWGALEALKTPIKNELAVMKRRREMVLSMLRGKTSFTDPDGAFYIFPQVPISDREFVSRAIERELLIVPGYIFTKDPHRIRISYAQKEDILEKGLRVFCDLLETHA